MSTPTFALVPSAYKLSQIYSPIPSNGNGDFTFIRTTVGTRFNKDGLIETIDINTPRLDYANEGCPELLMERASTNLVKYSEDFSQWSNQNTTDTPNAIISPTGNVDATKLESTTTSNNYISFNIDDVILTSTEYTASVFVKKGTSSIARLDIFSTLDSLIQGRVIFNFDTETISSIIGSASFKKYKNGWYRLSVTFTTNSTLGTVYYKIFQSSGVASEYIYIWGTQVEDKSKETSYIPSLLGTTTTRSIDRVNDLTTIDVTSDDWTLFINADYTDLNFSFGCISINDGDDDNNLRIMNIESSEEVRVTNRVGGTGVNNYNIFYGTWGYKLKIGIVSTSSGFDVYVNGELASSQTAGRIDMSGMTNIGLTDGSGDNFLGRLKDFRYYDTNLSSSELIKLTK